jgi:putative transposase
VTSAWIPPQHTACRVRRLGRRLAVARSGSDAGLRRPPRAQGEAAPPGAGTITSYLAPGRGPDGPRRLKQRGAQEGLRGRRRLGRRLAQAGRRCKTPRRGHAPPAGGQAPTGAPQPRKRELPGHEPATMSVGDSPALPTGEGWLSLAGVLELGSRAVVGWSMAAPRRAALANQALAMAIGQRQPAAGLLRQPDRGSQDGADSERPRLIQPARPPSRSRKGHGGENAVAASFLHTLKTDVISMEKLDPHAQAQTAGWADSDVCYNRQRCHAAHGSRAPLVYAQT